MTNTATKKQWVLGIISLFVLLCITVSAFVMKVNSKTTLNDVPVSKVDFDTIMKETISQVKFQEEVERGLLAELKSGTYLFNEPLVVVDPYNQSPLTALLLFNSAEPLSISVHIEGKDNLSNIDFIFNGYNTEHIIPIYGLYPDTVNNVTLTSKNKNGINNKVVLKIKTQPLAKDLNDIAILAELASKDSYQEGLNFTYSINKKMAAFDAYGEYRWYLKDNYASSINYHFNHRLIVAKGSYDEGDVLFYEINPLGKIFRILYSPYGLHHDIETYKNGNFLATGTFGKAEEDFIYEINTQTGKIENTLDLKTVLQRSRKGFETLENSDWIHNNAITWLENEDAVLISGRNQSTVAKVSWPSGKIEWILSSHDNWSPMFEKYLLTPLGTTFEWPFNQHAPEVLPDYDNNPGTIDIFLFDNGNQRFRDDKELQRAVQNNEVIEPGLYSRMVHYRINEKEKTVEQIWQYGKEWGEMLYSPSRGDADMLANGDRLGVFSIQPKFPDSSNFDEVSYIEVSANSEIVWQARAMSKNANASVTDYRAERMDIYNAGANNLQIGTPVNNLIPEEILNKYGVN